MTATTGTASARTPSLGDKLLTTSPFSHVLKRGDTPVRVIELDLGNKLLVVLLVMFWRRGWNDSAQIQPCHFSLFASEIHSLLHRTPHSLQTRDTTSHQLWS